jgi:hypothetical protein
MIRPDRILHQVNVARWTREESHEHLVTTFELAANHRPDLFEPYLIRLVEAEQDEPTQMQIMREALRETFALRYPNRHAHQAEAEPDDSVT